MFDGRDEESSLMECILHLVPTEALAAASKTVGCLKFAHHVQAYFLHGGDYKVPSIFKVFQVHDGNDIATRRIEAIQEGKLAFLLLAAFLKEADGFEHQEVVMPTVPSPDMVTLVYKAGWYGGNMSSIFLASVN
ncbi:hypothetical protein Droror1_Dr00011164 [Drosera rotundifolia]